MKEVRDATIRLTVTDDTRPLDWTFPTEDSGVVAITAAMARLTISGETCPRPSRVLKEGKFHFPWRPTDSSRPMAIDGESTRVRRTLTEDTRLWLINVLQSTSVGETQEAKEEEALRMESHTVTCSRVTEGESIRVQQTLRIAPETQVKETLTMSQTSTCVSTHASMQQQSTRVNQTLIEDAKVWWDTVVLPKKKLEAPKEPLNKRKWEADDPADGRR